MNKNIKKTLLKSLSKIYSIRIHPVGIIRNDLHLRRKTKEACLARKADDSGKVICESETRLVQRKSKR